MALVKDDWVLSTGSNVCMVHDRRWFSSFTNFPTYVAALGSGHRIPALGVGTVTITPRSYSNEGETITIRDVVLCPSAMCNVLGVSFLRDTPCRFMMPGGYQLKGDHGHLIEYQPDFQVLPTLELVGPQPERPMAPDGQAYVMSVFWPAEESQRWAQYKAQQVQNPSTSSVHANGQRFTAPYTEQEKQWLKAKFGNEFKFLRDYGLSIYKEEDRDEGRAMLRAFMADDDEDDDDDEAHLEGGEKFLSEIEADPSSHAADYHFNAAELEWIETHYEHSGNFLRLHGLKFYDDDDLEEGKAMVQQYLKAGTTSV